MEKVLKAIISKSIKHYELYREVYSKGWTVEQIMNASLDEVNKIKDVESQFKHASFKHLEVIQKNISLEQSNKRLIEENEVINNRHFAQECIKLERRLNELEEISFRVLDLNENLLNPSLSNDKLLMDVLCLLGGYKLLTNKQ